MKEIFVSFFWLVVVFMVWNCWSQFLVAQWPSFYSWCVILNTLSYITNLKYKLFGILRNSTNEEPGVAWIKRTREKSTILKENSNHDNDNDDKADIISQMFRMLLREIEDFKL